MVEKTVLKPLYSPSPMHTRCEIFLYMTDVQFMYTCYPLNLYGT